MATLAGTSRPLALAGILVVVALATTACGSSTGATTSSSASGTKSSTSYKAYEECLAAHGFTFPSYSASTSTPPTTVPAATRRTAQAACRSERPVVAKAHHRSAGGAVAKTAVAKYRACLFAHGVSPKQRAGSTSAAPSTTTSTSTTASSTTGASPDSKATLRAARKACASLKPPPRSKPTS